MKLTFLCGSLEPGHDGVGDYTRRLSGELIRQGHECMIVALNDRQANKIENEIHSDGPTSISVLRIPHSASNERRFSSAKECVDLFNPEWLSLQYVPFSFHDRGLHFGLAAKLKKFGDERKWHVMFHELWVGMETGAAAKANLWGRLQRLLIKRLVRTLSPAVINTQTRLYSTQLQGLGCNPQYLPLFGNIPVEHQENSKTADNSVKRSLVVFGSIHYGAPIEQFASEIADYSAKFKLPVEVSFVGRSGNDLSHWVKTLRSKGVKVNEHGELSAKDISKILSVASVGISTTPFVLSEKSGSIAAMLEHRLTVICVARTWGPHGFERSVLPETVLEYEPGNLELLLGATHNPPEIPSLPIAAKLLIDQLS